MSLKRYLFVLIALLIVILAAIQLTFVSYIKGQVAQEVQGRSQALSERVIDFVAEEFDQLPSPTAAPSNYSVQHNDELAAFYHIKIHPPQKQLIEVNEHITLAIPQGKPTIELIPKSPSMPSSSSLKELLRDIKITQNSQDSGFSLLKTTEDGIEQQMFEFDQEHSASHQYFNYLSIFIVSLGVLGLILAYWLANHVTRPLGQLTQGFKQLEAGDLGVTVNANGVSEIKQTLERFNQMSVKLDQLSQQEQAFIQAQHMADIGEMTRGLAHALRNPINTIGLSLEQMAQQNTSLEQRQKLAAGAREKISSMDNTIKSLLTLAAQRHIPAQALDVVHVIQDIILEVSATSNTLIAFDASQPLPFIGHESELRAIFHCVIVNAIEAGDERTQITITSAHVRDLLEITVCDNGSGIAPEIEDKLFQPHITSKPEGAGMGLYIAKRLCQMHYHGQLTLTNNDTIGATAVVSLQPITLSE